MNNGDINKLTKEHPMYDIILYKKSTPKVRDGIIKLIQNFDERKQIHNQSIRDTLRIIKLVQTTKVTTQEDNDEPKIQICPLCNEHFNSKPLLSKHLKLNADCKMSQQLKNSPLIKCPTPNCNSWWNNELELNKHLQYHCHLTSEEKDFFQINEDETQLNRKKTTHIGLPKEDTLIANKNIKYTAATKTWNCQLCTKMSTKYNRRQMINHVNTMRTVIKTTLKTKKPKGANVEINGPFGKILTMEKDYGKITIAFEPVVNSDICNRVLKCTRCGYENLKKGN